MLKTCGEYDAVGVCKSSNQVKPGTNSHDSYQQIVAQNKFSGASKLLVEKMSSRPNVKTSSFSAQSSPRLKVWEK
jgi:hypothetical protein